MNPVEPPGNRAKASVNRFYIIPDQRGHYTVRDEYHLHGGYFIDRTQARKYALFENGNRPDLIVELLPLVYILSRGRQSLGGRQGFNVSKPAGGGMI
jgi:hypothetical protein